MKEHFWQREAFSMSHLVEVISTQNPWIYKCLCTGGLICIAIGYLSLIIFFLCCSYFICCVDVYQGISSAKRGMVDTVHCRAGALVHRPAIETAASSVSRQKRLIRKRHPSGLQHLFPCLCTHKILWPTRSPEQRHASCYL